MLLSGKTVAEKIFSDTKKIITEHQLVPGLAVVLVGDDAPSHLYVGIKEKKAKELGIFFVKKVFGVQATEDDVLKAIDELNQDDRINGIIVQLPLPDGFDTDKIIASIEPKKDTDGFHPETIQKFLEGDHDRLPVFPRAMLELVREVKQSVRTKGIAMVNSSLMGEVLQRALADEGLEGEYILRSEKELKKESIEGADVILTATGEAESFSSLDSRSGAVIVDGGISYDSEGKVVGDVARDDGVYREDVWVTPVPGGVGPVTVAVLLARVTEAALRKNSY